MRIYEETVFSVFNYFRDAAYRGNDWYRAITHAFKQRHGQSFKVAGQYENIQILEKIGFMLSRYDPYVRKPAPKPLVKMRQVFIFCLFFSSKRQVERKMFAGKFLACKQ